MTSTGHIGSASLRSVPGPALGQATPAVEAVATVPFAEAVADVVIKMHRSGDPGSVLDEVVAGAVGVVTGCEHAALVIYDKSDQLVAQAVSSDATAPMIALQNELAQGPCRDTAARNLITRAPDVPTDLRWPAFAARAAGLGIGSMLCVPLSVGDHTYGSLSMASGTRGAFTDESEALAAVFATHAAISMADARQLASLKEAVQTRDLIGQAKGILMERFKMTETVAFAALVRESQHSNVKLRIVCQDLCDTGELPSERRKAGASSAR